MVRVTVISGLVSHILLDPWGLFLLRDTMVQVLVYFAARLTAPEI